MGRPVREFWDEDPPPHLVKDPWVRRAVVEIKVLGLWIRSRRRAARERQREYLERKAKQEAE